MSENNKPKDLFSIDLSQNDFLDPSESKQLDKIFQAPAGTGLFAVPSNNPFDNTTVVTPPVVEVKTEEKPIVQVPVKNETKTSKANSKTKQKSELSNKIKSQVERRKNIKVDTTWNIAYAGNQYNPPENDMTLEQLREYLELDYPELSKERTLMEIDEDKKLIVPIVKGSKNG
ncbi:hypothetical protein ABWK22_01745 [Gottfriedia acidiceleris]|uniref:hypothetical protein n=1 Tax=Gottfriedia acidiceleris TaxID=371036 RepID=UPI003392F47E